MPTFEFLIRMLAILLMAVRIMYWTIEELRVRSENPPDKPITFYRLFYRISVLTLTLFLFSQLLGFDIGTYDNSISNKLLGTFLVIFAVVLSILARHELGSNWTHAADYQIKRRHALITTGIYAYIRHPIYLGFICMVLGVQLIVGSYLVLLFILTLPFFAFRQAIQEERLLLEHFGDEYVAYQKKTSLFLPYLL